MSDWDSTPLDELDLFCTVRECCGRDSRVKTVDDLCGDCYQVQTSITERDRELEALRGIKQGVRDWMDGNEPRAEIGKTDQCKHGLYGYEECAACNDEYFSALLTKHKLSDEVTGPNMYTATEQEWENE